MVQSGKFPVDRLHKVYSVDKLDEAVGDMKAGKVWRPAAEMVLHD